MTLRDAKAPALETTDIGGHRHRLRDRLIRGGPEALADYEVLEVLLFAAMPRGDTKALAKSDPRFKQFRRFMMGLLED